MTLVLGAIQQDRNRVGPQVCVDREQQTLVARAVTEALHHRQERRQSEAQPPIFLRYGHSEHAESSAGIPARSIEFLMMIGVDLINGEFGASELYGGALELAVLRFQVNDQ
jgi:hypothetical protein